MRGVKGQMENKKQRRYRGQVNLQERLKMRKLVVNPEFT